jgi:hypothetical protein
LLRHSKIKETKANKRMTFSPTNQMNALTTLIKKHCVHGRRLLRTLKPAQGWMLKTPRGSCGKGWRSQCALATPGGPHTRKGKSRKEALLAADVSPDGTAALPAVAFRLVWGVLVLCAATLALLEAVPVALADAAWAAMAEALLVAAAALTALALVLACPADWPVVAAVCPFKAFDVV